MGITECFRVREWPRFVAAKQRFQNTCVEDIPSHMRAQFDQLAQERDIAGMRVAVAVGSRGIVSLDTVVRETVANLKRLGAKPFILPAMGSHGGATPQGQRQTVELLGITEAAMGAPIVSSLDVEKIGETAVGGQVYVSKDALAADGIVVVNRVKMHTSFRGDYESGLLKMMVVGLGKHMGALTLHGLGFERMALNIVEMGTMILQKTNILCGVGIVENAYERTAEVAVVPAGRILEEEPKLLALSKALMPRIPYDELDMLVLRHIGKDVSGDGMDPNITGRYTPHTMKPDYHNIPRIKRLTCFDLTAASHGSAVGMGHLDVITQQFRDKIDFEMTYMNSITATVTNTCKMPIVMPDQRSALDVAAWTTGVRDTRALKICIIEDTLHLENMLVSEALVGNDIPACRVTYGNEAMPMTFDEQGNLLL